MDLSGWLGIAFFILSVPVGIATNLLTPRFQAWWGTTTAKRRERRIEKIKGTLAKLTVELAKLQGTLPPIPSEITSSVIKGPKHPTIEHTGFSTVGFGGEAAQMGFDVPVGLAFFIRNSEQRFETRAHEWLFRRRRTLFRDESERVSGIGPNGNRSEATLAL